MAAPTIGPYWTSAGKRRRFGKLEIWAEDGLIFCEWQDDGTARSAGDAEVLDLPGAKSWMRSFIKDLENADKNVEGAPSFEKKAYMIQYRDNLRGHLDVISETIRDAEEQGDQSDPVVRRKKLTQFLRSRRDTAGDRGRQSAGVNQQVDSLFFPQTTGPSPLVFLPSRPIAVIPPELPPNLKR